MKKNHELVIACLQKQAAPISSTQLAKLLHVSSRTIKNYMQEINASHPGYILSSKQGYLLSKQIPAISKDCFVPQTYSERASYIIKEFFVHQVESIDIYTLCDELYLSYSSIKALLQKMNQEYKGNEIHFVCKNDIVYVMGTQRNKRRFLTSILYKEAKGNLIDLSVLKQMFEAIDVEYIDALLHERFKQANCYINDFGYMNLNLHITVMLHSILTKQEHVTEKVSLTSSIEDQIIDALQQHFHMHLQKAEAEEMRTMIRMNIHMCQINNEEDLIESIGEDIYQLTKDLIHALNKQYHLDLHEQTLLLPLSLHLKNLMERLAHHTSLHNPLLDTLQSSCPLLFDCALYAADFLYQRCHKEVNKDEIAYIAMHIGADIERIDADVHKLKCILLCPDYQETRSRIYNYLLIHFDAQIQILQCVSFLHEIQEEEYDVLFSTVPVELSAHTLIAIPPFPSTKDLAHIFHSLESVLELRKRRILWQEFDHFFSSDLFYYDDTHSMEKTDILKLLCEKCWKQGHVSASFYQDVCNRDKAASTAFGRIAIPHSMKMDALHTKVALALSPQGILWDTQVVNVVLLIAINEKDSHLFKELYEALISFFQEDSIMSLLKDITSFQGFKDILSRFNGA